MTPNPTAANAFRVVLVSVLLAIMLSLLVGVALGPEADPQLLFYISIFIGQGFIVIPLIFLLQRQGLSLFHWLRLNPVNGQVVLAAILMAAGAVMLSDELDRLVMLLFQDTEAIEQLNEYLVAPSTIQGLILFLGVGIFAPIGEELLFRGFLQQALERHWKDVTRAVLISALTFAVVHLNPYWLIQAYIMGVLLGYLAWSTDSVIPAVIFHGVYNSLALLLANIYAETEPFYLWNNHVLPVWLLLSSAVLVFGFIILKKANEV